MLWTVQHTTDCCVHDTEQHVQVVIARFTSTELTKFSECLIAAHFTRGRIVLPFPDVQGKARNTGQAELVAKLRSVMGGTWPVFDDLEDVIDVCAFALVLKDGSGSNSTPCVELKYADVLDSLPLKVFISLLKTMISMSTYPVNIYLKSFTDPASFKIPTSTGTKLLENFSSCEAVILLSH